MAGTLTISTLSDGTNSTSATNCIQGSAKAWVNFNGTNGAIRAAYNVSSVTRNGTGNYTVNFTNALTDANYSFSVNASDPGVSDGFATLATSVPTASALRFRCFQYNAATVTDMLYASASVFR
jgi:hypothetical protein